MAISKILYMKDCGRGNPGKHLKQAIEYISVAEKTGDGLRTGGCNCTPDFAYEQMKATKQRFGKPDKRQGYHLIISFKENEIDADTAFELIGKFVKEYLGNSYEAIYAVHDNTAHVHGHIVFNSVNCQDGSKYRYEKGDWAREIQPIVNRFCDEYGLSTLEIDKENTRKNKKVKEWNEYENGKFVWSDMIKRDIDACILKSKDYDEFLAELTGKGYEIKQGKYLAIKPKGMNRYRRCKSLGDNYFEERIRDRIPREWYSNYMEYLDHQPKIITGKRYYGKYKRAPLTKSQRCYYAKLYRLHLISSRPYSQAWKYRDEIKKMHQYQEQYLFLRRLKIENPSDLLLVQEHLAKKKKEISKDKSRIYREKKKCEPLFQMLNQLMELQQGEHSYQNGDFFFRKNTFNMKKLWKN